MKLKALGAGVAGGVIWGLAVFVITIFIHLKGGGQHLILLKAVYWGYSVSVAGACLGLVYGFLDGFVAGAIFAGIYNLLAGGESAKAG